MGVPMPGLTPHRLNRAIIEVIVEAREAAGLSQRGLSERLERGAHYIQAIESGERVAPVHALVRIAYALGLTATEFMARVEKRL